jgi:hypothetical protein
VTIKPAAWKTFVAGMTQLLQQNAEGKRCFLASLFYCGTVQHDKKKNAFTAIDDV